MVRYHSLSNSLQLIFDLSIVFIDSSMRFSGTAVTAEHNLNPAFSLMHALDFIIQFMKNWTSYSFYRTLLKKMLHPTSLAN